MRITYRTGLRGLGLGLAATAGLSLALVAAPASAAVPTAPTARVAAGTLSIHGTPEADTVAIGVDATDPNSLIVDLGGGDVRTFDRSTFTAVDVTLGKGADSVTAPTGTAFDEALTVSGGAGDDRITGGPGADVLNGGGGNDLILGGGGNDLIRGGGGNDVVDGQQGADTDLLGGGSDRAVWVPGGGNDVVDGGSGTDALQFFGANIDETFAVSADDGHDVLTRNIAAIRMDLDHVEQLDLRTLGGADSVSVGDLTGTDLVDADVDLASATGTPDGSLDSVSVEGTDRGDAVTVGADSVSVITTGLHTTTRVTGGDVTDRLRVGTGAGDDTVGVSTAATALLDVVVDLGTGQR